MYTYKNGNYTVTILNDGTKIRVTKDNEFIPVFNEAADVKCTSKCKQQCQFCYEGCTKEGEHADLFKYKFIESLHPYTELALNGNDMDHPQLYDFLLYLKNKNIITNVTVNQNQFINNYDKIKSYIDDKLIHGLGISLIKVNDDFINKVKEFPNAVIHTINGILTKQDIIDLSYHNLKILILGYKELQRGINYKKNNNREVRINQANLYFSLPGMVNSKRFNVISFDNLAIEQLNVKRVVSEKDWNEFYMGDDGQFTFYIDMVKGEFAKNSLSLERFPIGDKTMDEMFQFIQKKYNNI